VFRTTGLGRRAALLFQQRCAKPVSTEHTTAAFDALRALHETPTIEADDNVVDTNRPWHSSALFDADFPAYHRLMHELFAFR
jgi:hypothetical protein